MNLRRSSIFSKHHSPVASRPRRPILARPLLTLLAPAIALTGFVGAPGTASATVTITKSGSVILDTMTSVADNTLVSTTTGGSNIQISGTGVSAKLFTGVTQIQISFQSAGQTVTLDSTNFSFTPTISVGTLGPGTSDAIVKNGANTIKFTGSNNYLGGTTVNAGAISIDNANSLGSGAVTLMGSGELTATGTVNLTNAINFSGSASAVTTTGTLILNDLNIPGGTTVFGSAGHAGTVAVANHTNSTISTGAQLQVAYGTLRNDGQLNFFTNTAAGMSVNAGATLAVNDFDMTVHNLQGAGNVTLGKNTATDLTINGGFFGGAISGAGLVTTTSSVTLTGANTYTGGTQIATGFLQIGNGGTTGSIVGTVVDSATLSFNRSDAVTFAGMIVGSGSVQKTGAGTLTLTGASTYQGGTALQNGKLSISKASAIGTGMVTLNSGTEFITTGTVNLSDTNTVILPTIGSTTLSTSGTMTLNSLQALGSVVVFGSPGHTGTVAIANDVTSSAATNALFEVAYGTLRNDGQLGFFSSQIGGLTVDAGATLAVNDHPVAVNNLKGSGKVTLGTKAATNISLIGGNFDGVISGAGGVVAASLVSLRGTNTYTGGTIVGGGAELQIGNNGATGSIVGPVNNGGQLSFLRSNAYTFAGSISGAGSVTQSGAGVLTLTGNSTYQGGTSILNGAISINNGNALGASMSNITLSAGTELTSTGTVTLNNKIIFAAGASSTLSTSGTLHVNTLSMGPSSNDTAIFGSAGHAGIIAIANGASDLTVTTRLEVMYGTLRNDGGLDFFTRNAAFTAVNTGATLAVNDNSMWVHGLQGAGKVTLGTKAATSLTINGGHFSGVISGAGGVSISGSATLLGKNTYTGNTQIKSASTLQIGAGGTTGAIVGDVTGASGSTLIFDHSNAVTFAGNISGSTLLEQAGSGVLTLTGNNTYAGGTQIQDGTISIGKASAIGTGNITLSPGAELTTTGTVTLSNFIDFGADGSSTLSTKGTLLVSSLGLGDGTTTVAVFGSPGHTGTIGVAAGSSLGIGTTKIKVAYGTLRNDGGLGFFTNLLSSTTVNAGATLAVNDHSMVVKSLQGAGKVTLGTNAATNLTLNGGNFSGVISGAGRLSTSNVTLSGANTYTGGTSVSGTLLANNTSGSATGTGPVDVTANSVLGGKGTIKGAITLESNSILYPGATSLGTPGSKLHGSSLIWNGGATLKFQIGATADELLLTGALTKGSGSTFNIDILDTGLVPGTYTLVTFGSTNFTLGDFNLELPPNYTGTLVENKNSLVIQNFQGPMMMKPMSEEPLTPPSVPDFGAGDGATLQAIPAPEPSSALLLALGIGSLLGRRWREKTVR